MQAVEQLATTPLPVTEPEQASSIGSDMSIVGTVLSTGAVEVNGWIKGELRGASLLVGASGQVEGKASGQEVTVLGRITGTIRALQVKLLGRAAVEGDIFHQRLSIEEEALFEGTSRPLL
jgi:cytoskeletal protein CcmA (bactofilin family)